MALDWTKLYKKYKGMWIALAPDGVTVLGVGNTLKEALVKARKKHRDVMPYLTRMPEDLNVFVGVS